ncbi:MAG: hypothetical protein KGK01_06720 [Bradyrhizobium sp.]|uniref:hypothetical protein n=1 Tax=Bradyrhizobium sp. TaxID=376 RepID=UPI001C296E87|nr:hypothetical protein [Bradyrhizobium sp.]MBU6464724.1 hypothetical protein [Pseudomonadota bacterium]MDE2069169.1 hypothetical protein [Bradyrhizobium sp.]MDE2242133.1 hypothetical protein [Bradyrhizobium sp.]MDE2469029.1 hypothetical protein [Bradyrhizobium sp.]
MPLQNRVTPFGEVVADPHRGMFTGNRGIIHDPATRTLLSKRWSSPAWLTCVCEFRGRRRKVMGGRSWTELFFLDEATAFSAGHRPCFYCRRDDANRFRAAWEQSNGVANLSAKEMDAALHHERLEGRRKRLHTLPMRLEKLPVGTMIASGGVAFLIADGKALEWSPAGYRKRSEQPKHAMLLTPPSTVMAFSAGYRPVLHPSAKG